MILLVEDKNLSLLRGDFANIVTEDVDITIFVKDKTKPVFTSEDLMWLLSYGAQVDIVEAATKEEMMFLLGGKAFSGEDCTLVQMELPIPKAFSDHVKCVNQKTKKTKSVSKRVTKSQTVKSLVETPDVPSSVPVEQPVGMVQKSGSKEAETSPVG